MVRHENADNRSSDQPRQMSIYDVLAAALVEDELTAEQQALADELLIEADDLGLRQTYYPHV